ncbi:MAG: hypothetical protein QOG52_1907, partial [Frankiaceae bacterium]|nr:hypothetical protein [Frankiaceae bacterium]
MALDRVNQAITERLDHAVPVHGMTASDKSINRALRSIDGSAFASGT